MAVRQAKRPPEGAEWINRVWPSPNIPPLRPQRGRRRDDAPDRDAPQGADPAALRGTGEGLAHLRRAVLNLRRGKLSASAEAAEDGARPPRPPRASQLTLLDWRKGAAEGPASAPRPWWARINWALLFSVAAMGVAGAIILPELVASARDGFSMLLGSGDSGPSPEAAPPPEAIAPQEVTAAAPASAAAAPVAPAAPGAAPAVDALAAPIGLGAQAVPLLMAAAQPDLALSARSALIVGATDLYAWNADQARPIGGLTKLMAAMVYLDTAPDLGQVLTVESEDVGFGGPSARLAAGWKYAAGDLLTAIVVGSENVAVEALVRSTGIGRDEFLIRMAEKAQLLGMREAAFYDPTGLDPQDAASSRDLALLVGAAMGYPEIARDAARREAQITPVGRTTPIDLRNAHPLASEGGWDVKLAKAGFTDAAGYCLAALAQLPALGKVTVVVQGAASRTAAERDLQQILSFLERKPKAL